MADLILLVLQEAYEIIDAPDAVVAFADIIGYIKAAGLTTTPGELSAALATLKLKVCTTTGADGKRASARSGIRLRTPVKLTEAAKVAFTARTGLNIPPSGGKAVGAKAVKKPEVAKKSSSSTKSKGGSKK